MYVCISQNLNTTLTALLLLKVFQIWEASNSKETGKIWVTSKEGNVGLHIVNKALIPGGILTGGV